jgi:hypothetical protein
MRLPAGVMLLIILLGKRAGGKKQVEINFPIYLFVKND